jgi:type I restriction enzyme, S subunit
MEVKPGYKQTEIGLIPEDWEINHIINYWTILDCKHITAKFVRNGIPIASICEVQSKFVDLSNANQTTLYFYNHLIEGGRKPLTGDLIFSRNATVGEVAQVVGTHPPFAMGQDVCILKKKSPEYSTDYLQNTIKSPIIAKQLLDLMVGSTFKRVNVEQIKNLFIPWPSLPEQTAIATALSDVDALISGLDRLIEKKRAIKQAAMQELLTGKRRLPGFSGEWIKKPLSEIGTLIKGKGVKKDDVIPNGHPCIRYGELYTHHNDSIKKIYSYIPDEIAKTSQKIKNGDILFAGSGETAEDIGKCAAYLFDNEAYAGGDVIIFSPIKQNSKFLGYLLNFPMVSRQKAKMGQGDAIVHISTKSLSQIEIPLPSLPEQTAIATVLSDMDAEISALEARRAKTLSLKQGMMQELLTGRIRLV